MKQRGFSLLELMIVTLIIAVIGAIALAQYDNYVAKSQAVEGAQLINGLKSQIAVKVSERGMTAGCVVPTAATMTGSFVLDVDITLNGDSCELRANYRTTGVNTQLAGRFVQYSYAPASTGWGCDSTDLPTELRPAGC